MAFTDIQPLDYYYMHGYKIMNPFCRLLSEAPQYRFILEWRDLQPTAARDRDRDSRRALADSVTIKVLMALKGSLDSKALSLLGIDEIDMNSVITGSGAEAAKPYVDMDPSLDKESFASALVKSSRETARERLGSLWELLVATRSALLAATPATEAMVIRGDTQGMLAYLATQGLTFPALASDSYAKVSDITWRTNQFFSTSVGNELASLAGRALVWLIRLKAGSSGRMGGLYASEAEVLFPYDVAFKFDGVIGVSSKEQIAGLKLNGFAQADALRARVRAVYEANENSWPEGKVRFLVASEQ